MKRNVLGKGLDILLPEAVLETGLRQIDIDLIKPNRLQPRMQVDPESLQQLADSISENGVLQPVIVRSRNEGNEFELVAGERRWRAAQRAGLMSIPAIIQDISDEKMLELALVENIQRDDLTAIEEAHAYQVLVEKFHLSQDEVARRVGKSRSAVANILRLLNLSQDVQQMLLEGSVSMGHARALLPLPENAQRRLARKVIGRGLSVLTTKLMRKKGIKDVACV
jgi:ParB family chromosome partitioning protein